MKSDVPFDPFAWAMIPIALYAAFLQTVLLGNPRTVSRDDLGKLGR